MADTAPEPVINVYDPENDELGSIPHSQLAFAKQQGLTEATPEQLQKYQQEQKYGGTGQQILTGLEGAASAASFGTSTGLERALGVPAEDIAARREENPIAHGVGQAAGLVGSSFLIPGGGVAGLMEGAGASAVKAAGLAGAETAAAKIGSAAVKGAVENMIFQGGDEVSKMLSSDPSQTVGTAAANVGLSGLIGGAFGAGIGSVNPLWEATFGKKTTAALTDLANETEHAAANGAFSSLPEGYHQKSMIEEALGGQKPNANEISAAADRLGVKPTAGTVSDSEMIQNMENNLIKRPTIAGHALAKETDEVFHGLTKASTEVLRDATVKSEAQVGKEIKDGLVKKLGAELEPIEAKYKEFEPHFKAMQVGDDLKQNAIQPLLSMNDPAATSLAHEINNVKSVDGIKTLRTKVNARIQDAIRGGYKGASEELPALYEAKNGLNAMRESAIEVASKETGIGNREASKISSEMIQDIKETDKAYRAYKEKLTSTGREAGIGKVGNARKLLEKLQSSSDESFASKIFDTGDINQLKFFQENYPKEFELARRYRLKEIAEKSIDEAQGKNGRLNVGKFLRQISDDKLGPEAKQMLFQGNSQKIEDIRTIFRAMPGNANPSGTAAALAHGNLFSIQGGIDNIADGIKYAVIKNLPSLMTAAGSSDAKATGLAAMMFLKAGQAIEAGPFKAAVDTISSVLKADSKITRGVSDVFKSGREIIPSKVFEQKDFEKMDKKLKDLQSNVNPLFDSGGKVAGYMPDAGAHMSQTAVNAVNYLNSLRPSEDKKMPLDGKIVVSKPQQAAYHRAIEIAEQPLTVLGDVKNGTITPADVMSLKTMYPGLYSKITQKFNDEIINKTHDDEPIAYKTKLGIALFMGQPLDSTMTPASIMAIQNSGQSVKEQPQPQSQGQKGSGPHSMKNLGKLAASYATPDQARQAQKLKS